MNKNKKICEKTIKVIKKRKPQTESVVSILLNFVKDFNFDKVASQIKYGSLLRMQQQQLP